MSGFWIFLAAFVVCDTWVFISGYDSMLHKRKTEREKKLGQPNE